MLHIGGIIGGKVCRCYSFRLSVVIRIGKEGSRGSVGQEGIVADIGSDKSRDVLCCLDDNGIHFLFVSLKVILIFGDDFSFIGKNVAGHGKEIDFRLDQSEHAVNRLRCLLGAGKHIGVSVSNTDIIHVYR